MWTSQQNSAEAFPLLPHNTLVWLHGQDSGFYLLYLHDWFRLSWPASSFWVFPSVKWGESIMPPPSLYCRREGDQASGGCQLLGGRLPGGRARAGVGDRRRTLEVLCLEAQVPSSSVMHGKLHCGFSPNPTWPSFGQGLEPHDLSGLWSCQVKPAASLPPMRKALPIPGREAREFHNLFLDKWFQCTTIFIQHMNSTQ